MKTLTVLPLELRSGGNFTPEPAGFMTELDLGREALLELAPPAAGAARPPPLPPPGESGVAASVKEWRLRPSCTVRWLSANTLHKLGF